MTAINFDQIAFIEIRQGLFGRLFDYGLISIFKNDGSVYACPIFIANPRDLRKFLYKIRFVFTRGNEKSYEKTTIFSSKTTSEPNSKR